MNNNLEVQYCSLLRAILDDGKVSEGRNAVTSSIFGHQLKYYVGDKFPVPLMRKLYPKGVIGEMAAFLRGPKTVQDFEIEGCNYWKQWAKPDGSLNVDYGNKWIDFGGVNQLENVISDLQLNPHSRRHLISGWDPTNIAKSSLPCCHYAYQFYVTQHGELNMVWIQRSIDVMIGLPSDIMLANMFIILVAYLTNLKPGAVTMQLGDCHIYGDHAFGAIEYLARAERYSDRVTNPESFYPVYELQMITDHKEFNNDSFRVTTWDQLDSISFKLHA